MNDPSAPETKKTTTQPPAPPQGEAAKTAGMAPNAPLPPPPRPGEAQVLPKPGEGAPYRVFPPEQPPQHGSTPGANRLPLRIVLVSAIALFAVIGLIAFFVFRPSAPRAARGIGARLDLAAGEVTVSDSGETKALSGTPLATGATITTGKGARALVRTGEGAAIFLRGETSLKLLDRGVEVISGEVWLDVPRVEGDALEVKTGPYAVSASDAGLSVKSDAKDASVYVARGLAVLSSPGGRVEVGAGEEATAKAQGRPTVGSVKFWNDWTGGMGDQRGSRFVGSGTGRLYGLDPNAPPGAPARKLGIAKQVVKAVVRDGVAETEVDQTFSNPGSTPIEGYYWFTVPKDAMVTSFALETNGVLVEGEVIEKREAAAQYAAAMRAGNDPALLEWVDGRTYRARIYPIPQSGTRRLVLRYLEMLPIVEGKTRYVYPLRSDDPVRFDEFALSVDLGAGESDVDVASSLDARVENGGRLVTMRRSGYVPRADFQLELAHKSKKAEVSAWRFAAGADQADYVMLRYVPNKDFARAPSQNADVVVVVDTSAGGDETSRQLRVGAAEAALRSLSDSDHFALVTLDVAATVIYPKDGLASASEKEIANALEKLADHAIGGATDLGAMFEPALARLHGKEQAAVIYVGDGAATSGETGSEALLERMRRSLTGSRARFFAIGAGAAANHELLGALTRAGGGQYVRIDEASQTTGHALRLASAVKTPTITDVAIDLGAGLDQPLYSATGKLSRGEELVLLARTHHPLPSKLKVRGRFAGKSFEDEHDLKVETSSVTASLVPRLWASEYVRRLMGSSGALEENRGQILQLGVEYGLITPYSSSIALEDESAYARQGIQRKRSRVRGVRLTALEKPGDEENMMRALPHAAPPTAMGCSKAERSAGSLAEDDGERGHGSKVSNAREPAAPGAAQPMAGEHDNTPSIVATPTATAATNGRYGVAGPAADESAPGDSFGGIGTGGGAGGGKPSGPSVAPARRPVVAQPAPLTSPAMKPRVEAKAAEPAPATNKGDVTKDRGEGEKNRAKLAAAVRPQPVPRHLAACSDVASRPLSERIVLWQKRAKKLTNGPDLATVYTRAYAACELPDWRDEAALLDVLQQRVETEHTAEAFLQSLAGQPDAQRFVARNLLRRTVDLRIAAAVTRAMYHGVDWNRIDTELATNDKLDKQLLVVNQAMLAAPGDPQGDVRKIRVLARGGQKTEAVALGRRLRDRGFMTPTLAQQLGDVLVDNGDTEEALRTYSEIVEYDGQSRDARRVLGDIFQRQGWYPAAYRQYKTLTDLDGKNPLAWLRLANAAAGAGRVDEALRIEREVASGEGTPGPTDPRVFARFLSGSRLASLLATPDPSATPEALSRKLKELSLFSGPGTLALLTWDDLDAQLVIGANDERKENFAGETTDAGAVGLFGVLTSSETWGALPHAVRVKSDLLARKVPFRLHVLTWDGKTFKVTVKKGELRAGAKQEAI